MSDFIIMVYDDRQMDATKETNRLTLLTLDWTISGLSVQKWLPLYSCPAVEHFCRTQFKSAPPLDRPPADSH